MPRIPLLFLALLLLASCARNPVTGKRQVVLMSEEQEIAMGREADPQIVAQFGLYPDSALQRFIRERGQAMAAISHRPNLNYTFRVLDATDINAFAVPGGFVYFTRGILAHFNNEAEFAGVLGHEIGHVTARHSVEQQRNALLGQLGLIAGMVIAPELGGFAQQASQGLQLLFLKFGRDAERESDRLGVEYSSKIGYDAREMGEFFGVLQRLSASSGAGKLPNFLSTHPDPGDRLTTVTQLARQWQQQLNLTNPTVARNQYLQRIEGIIYGEDPKAGYVENSVFYHPELRFQFPVPASWRYVNSPQQVQLAAPDGKALVLLMLAPGASVNDAASAALQQYGLQQVEARNVTVNGLQALAVVADQRQQNGAALRTLSYFISHGGNIYHLIGVSALNDFNNYASTFSSVMQNFGPLSDASKINKQPERIRLRTAAVGGTLSALLRNYGVPQNRLEEVALLNGMQLNEAVPAGSLIKVLGQ